jgi:hypothetical protein
MVEEPTKILRGALAFFRGASCSIKTRDPTFTNDRIIDFAMLLRIVNAANKNKRVLFDRPAFWRTNSLCRIGEGKNVLGDRSACRELALARNDTGLRGLLTRKFLRRILI